LNTILKHDKAIKTEEVMVEFKLPRNSIFRYKLDKRLKGIVAVVRSFSQDILYILDEHPNNVVKQIRRICGKNVRYTCTAVPMQRGV
jgi:hypothetical protein